MSLASTGWPALDRPPTFLQARHWSWLNRRDVRLIVMHTAECSESKGAAAAVANYFHGDGAPQASSHLVVDATEIWECVRPEHEAWAAVGGDTNRTGYHVELCGRAAQGVTGWADAYSQAQLTLAAKAVACIAARYGIPCTKLTPAQVAAGAKGFCGHVDVTKAYRVIGNHAHTDPGPAFPWAGFLDVVQRVRPAAATGAL